MNWSKPKVYAVKHRDLNIRMASRSGGIFTALSDEILKKNGIVYGCVLTDDFKAVHIRATTEKDRNKMRGSKYIQSEMRNIFRMVKEDLDEGRQVLFSGTSCQIMGLKVYLGKIYDNLVCMDIVCHGVPSPIVWNRYLAWQENKKRAKINKVDFRNKVDFGWAEHVETLYFDNGKKINSIVFKNLFYNHQILRPCCYKCPYKDIMHPGDITIGDYWGIDRAVPGFNDNKGVSLVLINNEKGQKLFDMVKDSLIYQDAKIEDSLQPPLKGPFDKPENRECFWNELDEKPFKYIAQKYGDCNFKNNIRRKLGKLKRKLKKRIKTMVSR